ncbi:MAG TPA: iron chelate uptake ABC transporter family permease subunit [Actinomycetota bacterium]|nr:iron chelate uptake ABC transporter family permease subunit [Actinomycetota bacterium]
MPARSRRRWVLPLLVGVLGASVVAGVAVGTVSISPLTSVRLFAWKLHLAGQPTGVPDSTHVILFQLRLPRVLLAGMVGAGLAAAGALFQALFRNPMADPAIIGVSSGAAMGAIGAILAGAGTAIGGLGVPVSAFAGALATGFLVYRLARLGPTIQVATLLLAGIAVAGVISAAMSLVMTFSGEQIRTIYLWLLGGLSQAGWRPLLAALPFVVTGAGVALFSAGDLNVTALGEERAAQLGVEVERFKRLMLGTGALLTAAAVSVAGVIGFVGLMTPHVLRLVVGADHRRLLPASLLGGAAFMILADLVARSAVRPEEVPVGVITALLGGPFFLYLLRKQRRLAGARG